MKRLLPLIGAMVLCVAFLGGCAKTAANRLPALKEPIRFSTTDPQGRPMDEGIFQRAALTLLAVFSTDCGPCGEEMPVYESLAKDYEPGQFQVIGIAANHDAPPADGVLADFVKPAGDRFQVLLYSPEMAESFLRDVKKVPVHFWVDRAGKALAVPETGRKAPEAFEAELKTYLGLVLEREGSGTPAGAGSAPAERRKADGN